VLLASLNGYEVGLLAVAAVFVAFALVVALVVPRARPDFPAKKLGVFLAVCIALFAAQMTAVLLLAELGEEETEAVETTPTETTPTETTPTETQPTTTEPGGAGDPVAGKSVFASAGCASCHTLADAGSTGTIGPNLDAASPSFDKVVERVTNGKGVMPSFKDSLSEEQIADVAAYVSSVAGG
jgi:mono/diheme cytochrome c family protein